MDYKTVKNLPTKFEEPKAVLFSHMSIKSHTHMENASTSTQDKQASDQTR
jgi:hypothetical protein